MYLPNEDDNHWDDDPSRSLSSPADLCPFKPRADVTLVGSAFAPHKQPVRSLLGAFWHEAAAAMTGKPSGKGR